MRIGIDADGVLTELESYLWDYGSKFLVEHTLDVNIEHTQYNTMGAFGWDEEKDNMFWKENYDHYCKTVPVKRFAPDIIKKLKQEGHEIYIITARGYERFTSEKGKKKSDKILKKCAVSNAIKAFETATFFDFNIPEVAQTEGALPHPIWESRAQVLWELDVQNRTRLYRFPA